MSEGNEGGAVTVCEDDDDGAVLCFPEDVTTARCEVTTNFQDEDRNEGGEGTGMFNFFRVFRFLQFFYFFGCPCGFRHRLRLAFFFQFFSRFFSFSVPFCSAILIFGMLMHDRWPSGKTEGEKKWVRLAAGKKQFA